MEPDLIEAALARLGPEARALVELSVVREVADEDIAGLLGTDEEAVRSRREDALAALAADLGVSSGRDLGELVRGMRELPGVRWREEEASGLRPQASGAEGPEAPETSGLRPQASDVRPETPGVTPPTTDHRPPTSAPRRPRRLIPALVGGLMVAAVVALVLALAGDDGDGSGSSTSATSGSAELEPVAGGGATGTAKLDGDRLEMSVRGLPDPGRAGYVVWLYNSLFDARPLTRPQRKTAFDVTATLPQDADRYRSIDVSLEPADPNRNHSGQSVLRVPLSSLR